MTRGQFFSSQSANVVAAAAELHEMALRHADEHSQLSFPLESRLSEAGHLEGGRDIQKQFQTVRICASPIGTFARTSGMSSMSNPKMF